jgi:hypothetical protein
MKFRIKMSPDEGSNEEVKEFLDKEYVIHRLLSYNSKDSKIISTFDKSHNNLSRVKMKLDAIIDNDVKIEK